MGMTCVRSLQGNHLQAKTSTKRMIYYFDIFKAEAVLQTNTHQQDLYLGDIETIANSLRGQERIP
jgi:hypothetical protein